MTELLTLSSPTWQLALTPPLGGGVSRLALAGRDVLRPLGPGLAGAEAEAVRQSGGYMLAPYSNRIADAVFPWEGETVRLTPNFGDHPHSLHGLAWQRAWAVESRGASEASLVFDHPGDSDWPWRCRLRQSWRIEGHCVRLMLEVENHDDRDMPAGLGWHPYFLRDGLEMAFCCEGVWLNDSRQLPERHVPVPADWDFSVRRPVGSPGLDHCFTGWAREARLAWPARGFAVTLTASEALSHLVVFTPEGRDVVGIEPVSHANDALNMADPAAAGMRRLAPGERLVGHIHLTAEIVS
ncbi:aldose 1-epimerase [Modicisalibacter coralii]|uniref:aldose 1-epimerase n=1 Tax=Modicisalibacter coralii TaxID=2304602 RepID=UPI00100B0AD1|nr:aldose 1-epimerase [Halomonas coralii]